VDSHAKPSSGLGLERSCSETDAGWLRTVGPEEGVEFLEAWFPRPAYRKHRHDTYAICLTTSGVQEFNYRGTLETSLPGQVVVLHPDEPHDGLPATDAGFGYRELYVEPALIFEALETLGHRRTLPFVRTPVTTNTRLATAITSAFDVASQEPLAIDSLVVQLAEGLLEACAMPTEVECRLLDVLAVNRAREFLDAEKTRVVRSTELEAVTGMTRYELARQFRLMCGTSPYRYSLMRRLDFARDRLGSQCRLVDVALDAGFADQAHFSRTFRAAFGLTPAEYRATGERGTIRAASRLP
jgi:AraC-like DNA-binding protein